MDDADAYPETFTSEFISHCRASGLPPRLFHDLRASISRMPRYIRLRPMYVNEFSHPGTLAASLGLPPSSLPAVDWLPLCFAIPRGAAVRRAAAYERGAVAAMDVSSVAAVAALRPRCGEAVWDVCCAPGMKIGLIADAVGPGGLAVGTDVRKDRLFAARAVLKRQRVRNVCLFAADGARFTPQRAALALDGEAKRGANGLTAREERRLRKRPTGTTKTITTGTTGTGTGTGTEERGEDDALIVFASDAARQSLLGLAKAEGFDRVLVDAECSHDGSLPHLFLDNTTRRPFGTADTTENVENVGNVETTESAQSAEGVDNARRMRQLHLSLHDDDHNSNNNNNNNCSDGNNENNGSDGLAALQLRLLRAGFAQLRPGGTLVYSTCSFAYAQNERIVRAFLRGAGGEAVALHPFDFSCDAETMTKTMPEAKPETKPEANVSPAVGLSDAQAAALRDRLNAGGDPYGIVAAGDAAEGTAESTGVRFWPHAFDSSFQFVAKIWKKPRND